MCVIVCSSRGKIPGLETLQACREMNPHGIGLAWQTVRGVQWQKGLSFAKMRRLLNKVHARKCPYVLHFRVATRGERVPSLCHPFPIQPQLRNVLELAGTSAQVLAHNGTVPDSYLRNILSPDLMAASNLLSDTALLALQAGRTKVDFGRLCQDLNWGYGQRIVTLSAQKGLRYYGRWHNRDSILYSNLDWKYLDPCRLDPCSWNPSDHLSTVSEDCKLKYHGWCHAAPCGCFCHRPKLGGWHYYVKGRKT